MWISNPYDQTYQIGTDVLVYQSQIGLLVKGGTYGVSC